MNKKKIINDPVYGFISIPTDFIFDVVQHPYVQRLRYIKQLSLTHLVYPGAVHTRFQHVLGAMHLMSLALDTLKTKGIEITEEEYEGALLAILLHDIGHGPFSHSLEHTLVDGVSHELISSLMMAELNVHFGGKLDLAISIFNDQYDKKFLHQLVSGQLDVDRMDYLNRDSFFTGVSEGVIGFDRLLKMLNVVGNEIVVEQKGIYSVEKFLQARRIMYWQVYLHKTVLCAEGMLLRILGRAKQLYQNGNNLPVAQSLEHFLRNKITRNSFEGDLINLSHFARLDDVDILSAIKTWSTHPDRVLSLLCRRLIKRELHHAELSSVEIDVNLVGKLKIWVAEELGLSEEEAEWLVWSQYVENSAYEHDKAPIKMVLKDGSLLDISKASDLSHVEALAKKVRKYAVFFPKELLQKVRTEFF